MDKRQTGVLYFLLFVHTTVGHVEPRCSKYDFEEKVLEKVIRFEHKMELVMDSVNEISAKVKDDLSIMKKEIEKQRTEQTNAFHQLAENITIEWMEIKKDFETMKRDLDGQESVLNETIHDELNRFNKSFDDLAAKVKQPVYAFSAYDLSSFTPTSGCTLVFAKTHLNDDGLYSTTTGKYTTPADGIYVFHSTLTSRYTTKDVYVEFKADERSIGKFMVRDYKYDISSSGSATTRLQKGTEVYLRVTAVGSGYRFKENLYYMNTFSGYSISH